MSLKVDESGRRGRSKSPGGRRSSAREPDYDDMGQGMPLPGSFGADSEDDDRDDEEAYRRRRRETKRSSPPGGGRDDPYRRSREDASAPAATVASSGRRDKEYYREREDRERDRDRDRERERDRDRERDRGTGGRSGAGRAEADVLQYLPQKYAAELAERDSDRERGAARGGKRVGWERESPPYQDDEEDHRRSGRRTKDSRRYRDEDEDDDDDDGLAYGKDPPYGSMSEFFPPESPRESRDRFDRPDKRAPASRRDDDDDDEQRRRDRPDKRAPPSRRDEEDDEEQRRREYERATRKLLKEAESAGGDSKKKRDKKDKERDRDRSDRDRGVDVRLSNGDKTYSASASYGRRKNGNDDGYEPPPSPSSRDRRGPSSNSLTVDQGSSSRRERSRDRSRDRRGDDKHRRDSPPSRGMAMLSVATAHHGANLSVSNAPASPLLESYKGTYQSMSPMPSPLLMPSSVGKDDSLQVVDMLSPLDSDDGGLSGDDRKKKKVRRARFSDPVDDASRLAAALKGDRRPPDLEPLVEILPGLTHEQMMALRAQYKALVKTGSERKGVNLAKHIRARLKDADPSLMKACYATALGRWESEAYWANFWYQGDKTRRELLIESLMGRPEEEVARIADGFSDKKYDNSLARCMRTELKEDKFKKAVMMVLEGRRMPESEPVDPRLVDEDVRELHHCVRAEKGGETAMIAIVVSRNESHLREILRVYNKTYKANFAKDALRKSGNLVGELLAHILNGVINKPVRDALLLNHAVTASRRDDLRRELLTSRLVRYHWDPPHMMAVKRAYRERYGVDLADAVREATASGNPEWGQFCRNLCITRMPDHVKRFEKQR